MVENGAALTHFLVKTFHLSLSHMTSDKSEVVFYSEAMGNGMCTYRFVYPETPVCFSHCFEGCDTKLCILPMPGT